MRIVRNLADGVMLQPPVIAVAWLQQNECLIGNYSLSKEGL